MSNQFRFDVTKTFTAGSNSLNWIFIFPPVLNKRVYARWYFTRQRSRSFDRKIVFGQEFVVLICQFSGGTHSSFAVRSETCRTYFTIRALNKGQRVLNWNWTGNGGKSCRTSSYLRRETSGRSDKVEQKKKRVKKIIAHRDGETCSKHTCTHTHTQSGQCAATGWSWSPNTPVLTY